MLVGMLAMRTGMFSKKALPGLSKFCLDVLMPALTFHSVTRNFNADQPHLLWQLPLVGFGIALAGFLGGYLFKYGLRNGTPIRKATFHHVCTLCNYLFLPIIIVGNLWGEKYVTLMLLTNVGSVLGMWTLSIIAIQPGGFSKDTLKQIFGINFWALILAVGWVMLKIPVPVVIAKSVEMTASMNIPLLIMLSGASIWEHRQALKSNVIDAMYLAFVRLIVLPAMMLVIISFIPMQEEIRLVAQIIAMMPAAVVSIVICGRYGGDEAMAGQAIMLTTILSMITVPLWLLII